MRRLAPAASVTTARTRNGSDVPIRIVGGRSASRWSSPACKDGLGSWTARGYSQS